LHRGWPAAHRSGRAGEDLAVAWLLAHGFQIAARNLRTRHAEIDVLARQGRTWIAVEVKARAGHPAPERCIAPDQLERLARALASLAPELQPPPRALRIDAIAIRWSADRPDLLHLPGLRHVAAPGHGVARSGPTPDGRGRWSNLLHRLRSLLGFP
jgi:putative endonuclease